MTYPMRYTIYDIRQSEGQLAIPLAVSDMSVKQSGRLVYASSSSSNETCLSPLSNTKNFRFLWQGRVRVNS